MHKFISQENLASSDNTPKFITQGSFLLNLINQILLTS